MVAALHPTARGQAMAPGVVVTALHPTAWGQAMALHPTAWGQAMAPGVMVKMSLSCAVSYLSLQARVGGTCAPPDHRE